MHHFNHFLLLTLAAALLSGCPETTSCADGRRWDAAARECVSDSNDDGGPVDAAEDTSDFCDTCAEGEICDRANAECDQCDPSITPTTCDDGVCDPTGQCVECNVNADCTNVAESRCFAQACEVCAGPSDCEHLLDTRTCDVARMECVGCLSNDDCGPEQGCDLDARNCRAFTPEAASLCGACVRDAECSPGLVCAPTTYDDPRTPDADPVPVGTHCLWPIDATGVGAPNGACSTVTPYEIAQTITSVDGVTRMVCTLRQSTCEAHDDFAVDCMTLDAAGDARCGRGGVSDGVCRRFDAAANRCTVLCATLNDCPNRGTRACDTSGTPAVCSL